MDTLPTCPRCGREVPDDASFCPRDGAPLVPVRAPTVLRFVGVGEEKTHPRFDPSLTLLSPAPAPPALEPVPGDPLIGSSLGEYVVKERIGSGGMGMVYRAVQPLIEKEVAVKILKPEIAGHPEQVKRLLDEARAVNAIRHRGIIDIFGFGQLSSGQQYVVMEFLHGVPLDKVVRESAPLPVYEVVELLDEVLAALGAAHQAGVIHRDLKPSNLFKVLQPDGSYYVKVLDFGLAKRSTVPRGATPQTRMDMTVGTPDYIAPEQARGAAVSPRTDLYSLGVVAFELLTGRLPFIAPSAVELMMAHLHQPPPRPSSLADGIPPEIEELVLQLLEKRAENRPESAEAVRLTLKRIARSLAEASTHIRQIPQEPIAPPAPKAPPEMPTRRPAPAVEPAAPATERLPQPLRPRSHWIASVAITALLIVASIIIVRTARSRPPPVSPPPVVQEVPEVPPAPVVAMPESPAVAEPPSAPPERVAPKPIDASVRKHVARPEPVDPVPARRRAVLERIDELERRLRSAAGEGKRPDVLALAFLTKARADAGAADSLAKLKAISGNLDKWQSEYLRPR